MTSAGFELLIRSHLEVSLDRNDNRLVYVEDRCQPATVVSFRAVSSTPGGTSYPPARHPCRRE